MKLFHPTIVCCYLYPITRYGYPPSADQTETHLQEMKGLGFQSVELEGVRETHLLAMYQRRYEVKQMLTDLELQNPYFCCVLPGLAASSKQERERNLTLLGKGCEMAALLGARGVLDNSPLPPYQFESGTPLARHFGEESFASAKLPDGFDWQTYWRDLAATYRSACDIAEGHGLTFHLHPCEGALCAASASFLWFRDAVERDSLRFNFDTANQFYMKDDLVLALHQLAGCFDYLHLSDNRGKRVEHLEPGCGAINWDHFFKALAAVGFKGDIGIDIGGAESQISDLDRAYVNTGRWLGQRWPAC